MISWTCVYANYRKELSEEINDCGRRKFDAQLAVAPQKLTPEVEKEYDDEKKLLEEELEGVTQKIPSGAVETVPVTALFNEWEYEEVYLWEPL